MSHTPGPWAVERDGQVGLHTIWGDDKFILVARTSSEANARLIAAAPELLRLVKLLRHVVYANGLDPVDENYWSILEQADIAIAKVER